MSTRSLIAKKNSDNTVTVVYCHWDGYPSNNGKILLENYKDEATVDQMISGGGMSSLGETPEDCDYYALQKGREDENNDAVTLKNAKAMDDHDCWQEYIYLFKNDKWYYKRQGGPRFMALTEKVCAK